jgi:hypothetical protein
MNDKRISARRRTLRIGTLEFNGGGIDCVVRNISEKGAALEVASPLGIPDRCNLIIMADQSSRPCRVVWRKAKRIGVTFE